MKKAIYFLPLALILVFGSFKSTRDKVVIKMHLNKGDTYNYRFVADMNMSGMPNSSEGMKMGMEMEMGIHVDDIDQDGKYLFSYTIQNAKMKMAMDKDHTVTLDTRDADDKHGKEMKDILKKLVFKALIWPNGRVSDLKLDQLFDSLSAIVGSKNIESGRKKFDSIMNSPQVKQSMLSGGYPDKEMGIGDTWSPKMQSSPYFKDAPKIEISVKDITADKIVIGMTADVSFEKKKEGDSPMGMTGSYKITGNTDLDRNTCMPIEMKGDGDIIADISSKKEAPQKIKMHLNFRMTKF